MDYVAERYCHDFKSKKPWFDSCDDPHSFFMPITQIGTDHRYAILSNLTQVQINRGAKWYGQDSDLNKPWLDSNDNQSFFLRRPYLLGSIGRIYRAPSGFRSEGSAMPRFKGEIGLFVHPADSPYRHCRRGADCRQFHTRLLAG